MSAKTVRGKTNLHVRLPDNLVDAIRAEVQHMDPPRMTAAIETLLWIGLREFHRKREVQMETVASGEAVLEDLARS